VTAHEWRWDGHHTVCRRCGHQAREGRCPLCRTLVDEATVAHGTLARRGFCKGRPSWEPVPCRRLRQPEEAQ
jgi:hypothetical protein